MAQHTPAPWTFAAPWSGFSKITGPNGELIFGIAAGSADEKRSDEECEANACLIEAAPDLFDALIGLIGLVELIIPTLEGSQRIGVEDNHRLVAARAAIVKAAGEG